MPEFYELLVNAQENYDKAIELARESVRRNPDFMEPYLMMASAFGHLEKPDEARRAIGSFLEAGKKHIRETRLYAPVTKDCILEGLRKAGLAD